MQYLSITMQEQSQACPKELSDAFLSLSVNFTDQDIYRNSQLTACVTDSAVTRRNQVRLQKPGCIMIQLEAGLLGNATKPKQRLSRSACIAGTLRASHILVGSLGGCFCRPALAFSQQLSVLCEA